MTLFEFIVFVILLGILGLGALHGVSQSLSRHRLFWETLTLGSHLQGERLRSAWTDVDFVALPNAEHSVAYRARNRLAYYPSFATGKIGFTEAGSAKYSGTLRLSQNGFESRITLGVGLTPLRIYAMP